MPTSSTRAIRNSCSSCTMWSKTKTTNGRLYTNIHLSLARDEADRTSERVKFVLAAKRAHVKWLKDVPPLSYKVENKHLVPNPETTGMVQDFFQHHAKHGNKYAAMRYLFHHYGHEISYRNVDKILHNPIYKGEFHGYTEYCEPLVVHAIWVE